MTVATGEPDPAPVNSEIDVVVVGSLNIDQTTIVESIPQPGETVLGGDVQTFMGGKGLNQAVAAARAGATVAMIGRVGDDDGGRRLRERLDGDGIDHTWVSVGDRPTGMAFITVDHSSENAIVVSPGANATLTPDHVAAASVLIKRARVVLVQLEVPIDAISVAAVTADGMVLVNPAPARPLPADLMDHTSILIPNRGELATVASVPFPESAGEVEAAATGLADHVIVTLGSDGVMLVDGSGSRHFPPHPVDAVDTTGAGDCFCGSLAARLALGDNLHEAIAWASTAAALSVTRFGASDSMPTAAEVVAARQHGKQR